MGGDHANTTTGGETQAGPFWLSENRREHLLKRRVALAECLDLFCVDRCLGIQPMPPGYALMITPDDFFYWLRWDGHESSSHWNKWAVWRSARDLAQGRS